MQLILVHDTAFIHYMLCCTQEDHVWALEYGAVESISLDAHTCIYPKPRVSYR